MCVCGGLSSTRASSRRQADANKSPYTLDNARCTGTPLIASSAGFVSDARLGGRQDGKGGVQVREERVLRERGNNIQRSAEAAVT